MLYSFKRTFQKVKVFSVVVFDTSFGGMMGFISFMVGWHLNKRKPQSFILCKLTFQVEKVNTVVNTETVVIVEGRFSFHSWEAKVPYFFPRKSLHVTHSRDLREFNCFFLLSGKKVGTRNVITLLVLSFVRISKFLNFFYTFKSQ